MNQEQKKDVSTQKKKEGTREEIQEKSKNYIQEIQKDIPEYRKKISTKFNKIYNTIQHSDQDLQLQPRKFLDQSLTQIYQNTVDTIFGIIYDLQKDPLEINTIKQILTKNSRQCYIGVALITLSIILYFIDN